MERTAAIVGREMTEAPQRSTTRTIGEGEQNLVPAISRRASDGQRCGEGGGGGGTSQVTSDHHCTDRAFVAFALCGPAVSGLLRLIASRSA